MSSSEQRHLVERHGFGLVRVTSKRYVVVLSDVPVIRGTVDPPGETYSYIHYQRLTRPVGFDAAAAIIHRLYKAAQEDRLADAKEEILDGPYGPRG